MKFSCTQNELSKALNTVSKAVTSRTTIPILKGILLNVDEFGVLTMSAADLDINIEKKFEVKDCETGSVVVPAKLFGDIIRKLPNDVVTISSERENIEINCSSSQANILGFNADEFPKIISLDDFEEKITFNKVILNNMIKETSFAASIEESKGVTTGVLIEIKDGTLNMVALDSFRLAISRQSIKNQEDKNIIIPAKLLNEISKIISESSDESENIDLYINNKKAVFIIDDVKVVISLLSGNFVEYRRIFPAEQKIQIIANKGDLLDSLERASLLAKVGKNNLVKLKITSNNMEITSNSEEGTVKEDVIITKTGDDILIGFNAKYFMDALKAISDDEIKIIMNSAISSCVIRPLDGNYFEHLILPVRIKSN